MKLKISAHTVQSANERLIRDGNRAYETSCVSRDYLSVSVKYRGTIISQSITSESLKSSYGKSLKALADAEKL